MPPDLLFWLALFLKMAVTAAFVVGASIIAEKSGPAIGAMIATLPIAAAPAYIILSFDHDSAFIANGAIGSLAANAVTGIYSLLYAFLAQRFGLLISLGAALAAWFRVGFVATSMPWNVGTATLFSVVVFAVCIPLVMHYCHVKMPPTRRRWFDIPLRASLVAVNVAIVVTLSSHVGPAVTGQLAVFPIVLSRGLGGRRFSARRAEGRAAI